MIFFPDFSVELLGFKHEPLGYTFEKAERNEHFMPAWRIDSHWNSSDQPLKPL
jgi:hypothetical protein